MKLYKRTLLPTIKDWTELELSLKDLVRWNHTKISSEELKRWILLKPAGSVKDALEKLHYKV